SAGYRVRIGEARLGPAVLNRPDSGAVRILPGSPRPLACQLLRGIGRPAAPSSGMRLHRRDDRWIPAQDLRTDEHTVMPKNATQLLARSGVFWHYGMFICSQVRSRNPYR